jgi:acyl dehydratase
MSLALPLQIHGPADLAPLVGHELGASQWITIDQARIDEFAEATLDRQWIHCDAERAARESPYKTTIAHGYLTLSLGPTLNDQIILFPGARMVLNYGLNRVRFPNAVRSGSRLRLKLRLLEMEDIPGGVQLTLRQNFEVAGQEKPVCVADSVMRVFWDEPDRPA